jgi:hypothetical protein
MGRVPFSQLHSAHLKVVVMVGVGGGRWEGGGGVVIVSGGGGER